MNKGLFIILALLSFLGDWQVRATIDSTLQMQLGNPSGATADPNNHHHYLIQRSVEAIDYNDYFSEPNWASWDLTASDIGSSGRSPDFVTDTTLPASFYEVTTTDYSGSAYDRGHMCPSADRTDNDADNELVFYLSNIIPQAPSNNSGVWGTFEGYCRSLAQSGNELLIICGPGGFDGSLIQPSERIYVPQYVWKIVVVVPSGSGSALSRITTATRVIAIKIPNNNAVNSSWQTYVTSARQLEADTGFTFFSALPANVANVLLDKVDGGSSVPPVIIGFSPAMGAVNSSVVITGSNFGSASEVTFNGVSASFTVNSSSQITAVIPANATAGPISVTVPTGTGLSSSNFIVTGSAVDLTATATHFGNFSQNDTGDAYTITVTNVGTLAATGTVTVADLLPTGLSATSISGVGWTANLGALTCTRSSPLYAGAAYPPITVTVNVASNAPASVTNIATVSDTEDVNSANNEADDVTVINPAVVSGPPVALASWDMHEIPSGSSFGTSPFSPAATASGVTIGGLTRGSGVGTTGSSAAGGWGGEGFTNVTEAGAISHNQFFTFTVAAQAGKQLSFSSLNPFCYRRSTTGPATGVLQYQIGSGAFADITSLSYPTTTSGGDTLSSINLSGTTGLQNVPPGTNVTFRIVNYGGGPSGTWYIFDTANSTAADFTINGTLSAVTTSDLRVLMTHAGDFTQGDVGDTYLITVTNVGVSASSGSVSVADTLPPGLTATAMTGSGWTANLGAPTCTRSESLAPGTAYPPITLIVNVATNAAANLTNAVTISGGSDTNTANNTAADPTTIIALTPIQSWRLQWFGITDNSGAAADAAVATSDGMPNLLKYALGLNPLVPTNDPVAGDIRTGYLRLATPKNPNATDVNFLVQATTNLTAAWSTNGTVLDQNTPTLLQVHYNTPVTASPAAFLRLQVSH